MEKKVVSVIKDRKKMIRDTVDKVKCVVVFGLEEAHIEDRLERERKEKEKIRKVLTEVVEEGDRVVGQVEECYRLGKFVENRHRPIKIKFATQVQAEEVLRGSWKLAKREELKKVWISRDLDEEERSLRRELVHEANAKNDDRTEEERKQFYWKVIDLRVRKWYYRK